ncbi:MAG: HD domain-containing protein [Candidatus Paceibacterota bacterium]
MIPLQKLEDFMRLLHKVQNVKRVARVPDEKEYRNTAEHTFEVVLLCWYIASANKLDLDHEKILKYALAHDLLEAYSGDTPIHDTEAQKTKVEREARAVAQIKRDFEEFSELSDIIHEYEKRDSPESKFVYAVDKLIDPLNSGMETTQSIWNDEGISYDFFREYKEKKVTISDAVSPYWKQLLEKLNARKDFFFTDTKETVPTAQAQDQDPPDPVWHHGSK